MRLVDFITAEVLRRTTRRSFVLGLLALVASYSVVAGDETFSSLKVGKETYTNVTVLNKTRTDLFISHAQGMANVKVKDLEPATQLRLGYELERPKQSRMEKVWKGPDIENQLTRLETDPRVQEIEERLAAQFLETLDRLDPRAVYAIPAGIVFVYLWFCLLCRCICVKTSNPPSPLIWLPFLKQIPLFKSAGMSPWWILTNFIPPVFVIGYILWSFKIVHARGKHVFFGVMLLLPVVNLLAFLYLALSGSGSEREPTNRKVISLQPTPRRDAA